MEAAREASVERKPELGAWQPLRRRAATKRRRKLFMDS